MPALQDHGAKMGLNGVDNGRIWFHGEGAHARYASLVLVGAGCVRGWA